jgi:erythromycin esterase-like protein
MNTDLRSFVPPSTRLLALGEPTHLEPAFQRIRNELFARLAADGFRSIVLEIDRVAALAVNDFVQGGEGRLGTVLQTGFSHTFGDLAGNRELVAWMRDYNVDRCWRS